MIEKKNSETTEGIQRRFFAVLDVLISNGSIASLASFCDSHGLNRVKYSNLRSFYTTGRCSARYKVIDLDALAYISADFGVSLLWLIHGKGNMFI